MRYYAGRVVLLAALAAIGCSTTVLPYQPGGTTIEDPSGRLKTLLNLGRNPPGDIEVTSEYLKASTPEAGSKYGGGGLKVDILRFASIARVELTKHRSYYQAIFYDATGEELFEYNTDREADAREFLDAVEVMRRR